MKVLPINAFQDVVLRNEVTADHSEIGTLNLGIAAKQSIIDELIKEANDNKTLVTENKQKLNTQQIQIEEIENKVAEKEIVINRLTRESEEQRQLIST